MEFRSVEEIKLFRSPQPPVLIAGGVLHAQHKLIIYGGPKTFKSIFAQQLGFCLANGIPFLTLNTAPAKVLYIQSEISKWLFEERVLLMSRNVQTPHNTYYFSTAFHLKLDREQGERELHAMLTKLSPQVLILDPFYKLTSAPDEGSILRAIDALDNLLEHHKCAVVLVHHSRKQRTSPTGAVIDLGANELRGPHLEAWADSILRIRGVIGENERELDFVLRHSTTNIPTISFRLDAQRFWLERTV